MVTQSHTKTTPRSPAKEVEMFLKHWWSFQMADRVCENSHNPVRAQTAGSQKARNKWPALRSGSQCEESVDSFGIFQSFAARSIVHPQTHEPSNVTQQGVSLGYADRSVTFVPFVLSLANFTHQLYSDRSKQRYLICFCSLLISI